ncbi:MAG TPA: alpha-ketoglutarate-dependent dioxygenase AlkB, partial [Marmoricola sp.]
MTVDFQASLFDTPAIGVGPLAGRVERRWLSRGAWVDVLPGWFEGADELFATMLSDVPWQAEQRPMYDNVVDVPRLLHHYGVGDPLP